LKKNEYEEFTADNEQVDYRGPDLGNPERWFTNNPADLFPLLEECAENKVPAFISVQPEKDKAQLLGIEKTFFDFDYCKNSEIHEEAGINCSIGDLTNIKTRA
jgi:hypothetical protein